MDTEREKDRGRCSNENMEDGSERTLKEKDRGRCSNENMEDGSEWTLKERKTEEDVVMRTWRMEVSGH